MSPEVQEINHADMLVESTAIDDIDCLTELNDAVTNCNERYCERCCGFVLQVNQDLLIFLICRLRN